MAIKGPDGNLRCPPELEAARARTQLKPGHQIGIGAAIAVRKYGPKANKYPDGLTDKNREVVREYISNGRNLALAYQAVYGAHLHPASAGPAARKILKKPGAQAMVAEADERERHATERTMKRCEIDRERLIEELNSFAFLDPREVFTWSETGVRLKPSDQISEDAARAITEIGETKDGLKVKLAAKLDAIDKLLRLGGFYRDNVNLNLTRRASDLTDDELAALATGGGTSPPSSQDDTA